MLAMNDADGGRTDKNPPQILRRDDLADLRSLLLSPEQKDIAELRGRLDDPGIHADEISRVLAEAIVIRASRDNKLAQALLPTIEQTIKDSVRKDPKFLADAIFPIIGIAIRKAISESIRAMLQSLSETLTYALSWRGLQWRFEAFRTGKPFAEVVLLHTLIYRVEQIFLIHRETGLLLQHVAAASAGIKDTDMVSGMLTAIQDFVHDSFSVEENQTLQSLNVGDFTIWIEQGPHTVLAAVISGNPPEEFKRDLNESLEKIEFEQSPVLYSFDGNTAPFEKSRHHLEACLVQAKYGVKRSDVASKGTASETVRQSEKKKGIDLIWLIIGASLICLLIIITGIIFS
jgi:hypothetical protein